MKPVTTRTLMSMKAAGDRITCLTAYDFSFASLVDRLGVDTIIVGDSLGMVVQGHENTLPVTLEHMIYHSQCVSRGVSRALAIVDMPFGTYHVSREDAMRNAARLMCEGAAPMVKMEGGAAIADTVRFVVERGVAVCGHIGLTPQAVHKLGGFRVQGRDADSADALRRDALALQDAGISALVLEAIPASLGGAISRELRVPTIGIGAGPECDGQVLVLQDVLGIYPRRSPKFSRNFMADTDSIEAAVKAYLDAVRAGRFPGAEQSFGG